MRTACFAAVVAVSMLSACEDGLELADAAAIAVEVGTDARDGGTEPGVEASLDHTAEVPSMDGSTDGLADQSEASPIDATAEAGDGSPDQPIDNPVESTPDAPVPGPECQCTAVDGGELALGEARLLVPPGTLAADRSLTLAIVHPTDTTPNRPDILGDIYELGPDGTRFVVPIPLTLPLVGAVPAGKEAVVAWLDRGAAQWVPVPSMVNGTRITGFVTHFTSFAVVLRDADLCPYGGACGGSLEGNWEYSPSCLIPMSPRMQACGSGSPIHQRQSFTVTGTLAISADRYTMNRVTRVMTTLFYTPECLTAINQPQPVYADCAAVQAAIRQTRNSTNWNCAGSLQKGCSCYLNNAMPAKVESGAVTVAGNKLRLTKDGDTEPGPELEFCVRDGHLSIKNDDGSVHSARKMP